MGAELVGGPELVTLAPVMSELRSMHQTLSYWPGAFDNRPISFPGRVLDLIFRLSQSPNDYMTFVNMQKRSLQASYKPMRRKATSRTLLWMKIFDNDQYLLEWESIYRI